MQLAEVSIRRPVFAAVLSLLIILVGIVAWTRLTVREYPETQNPVVTVQTQLPGASSSVVEAQVTQVIEDALSGLSGVSYISSASKQGVSQVTITFNANVDLNAAASDVNSKVASIRRRLPEDVVDPVVSKSDANAQPAIVMTLSSSKYSSMELSQLADLQVKPLLQNAEGASEVDVLGESAPTMQIQLNPIKLAGYALTTQDVAAALTQANIQLPAGSIEGANRQFNITAKTGLQTVAQFKNLVLRNVNGSFVRLQDVASIKEEPAESTVAVRLNGQPVVAIAVTAQSTANPLILSKSIRSLLVTVQKSLPKGVTLSVVRDSATSIQSSISAVYEAIGTAVVLVAVVIFLFLRTIRASIIPLITIPVSLLGTFAIMLAAGFSINLLTLLALVLAVGLVVDDAIVMLENIYRHIEEGMPPFKAAITGAREVSFAIIAMTLTLVAVYAPLAFTPGKIGKLFTEFAFSLAGAVLVSGFVSLTLSPMMSSLLLSHKTKSNFLETGLEKGLDKIVVVYKKALLFALKNRWMVIVGMVIAAVISVALFRTIPSELAPTEDQGFIFAMVQAPDGSTPAFTERYTKEIVAKVRKLPEIERVFSVAGMPNASKAMIFIMTKPSEERKKSVMTLAKEINAQIALMPAVQAFAMVPPALGGGGMDRPLSYVVMTDQSYPELNAAVQKVIEAMKKNPGLTQIQSDLSLNQPELALQVNRDQAANLGVSIADVAQIVQAMMGGSQVGTYESGGHQYDIMMQAPLKDRNKPSDISGLFLHGNNNSMVPMSSLVSIENSVTAPQLNHFDKRRAAVISASLDNGYTLGQAISYMDKTTDKLLPTNYSTDLKGSSRDYLSSQNAMQLVFGLALFFIFLVLSAQFESFIDPIIIMLSVPLSLTGALIALKLTGGTMNVYSEIGMVTLVGLITKHGILIVEFANQLREQGMDTWEAVTHSAAQRFRPILMTTGAMVLGTLPLALATGYGSMSRQQIGWVVVGGMSLGTLFTIFVVPTVYTFLARKKVPGGNKEVV